MAIFGAIGVAGSGMTVARKWMDAVSDNLANMNTATRTDGEAFRQRYVVAEAEEYGSDYSGDTGGVRIAGVAFGSAEGRLVYEPTNPLADEEGYVRYPDIDLASQMGQLIISQRAYQANAAVVDRARGSYEAALQIGRGA
ncbi:flagellar basal body rod protein FlgC [Quadrisphaera sp. DSM 44207]|uniref:flagellar basal body rod protein FlgC n=1 Tax=Quadrisphaera sp. DSM 44207 TaxID=1881057 RepID=UPI0008874018|nr:flagellar basal body rod protein FlgC [Quadrisphaera sp. DSM 44207]SDQ20188.1 flagellar basal-body rod protein FlgC [Quadrisphaera sp. DSM 44207]